MRGYYPKHIRHSCNSREKRRAEDTNRHFYRCVCMCIYMCMYICTHTHTYTRSMEYYSAIKRHTAFVTTLIDLEDIMLSEVDQTAKDKYCMFSFICGI